MSAVLDRPGAAVRAAVAAAVTRIDADYRPPEELLHWHPVAQRLPDADLTVLCWGADGMHCGWWDDADEAWRDCATGDRADVTHWAQPDGPGVAA